MTNEPIKSENTDISPNPPAPQPKPGTCSEQWGYDKAIITSNEVETKNF